MTAIVLVSELPSTAETDVGPYIEHKPGSVVVTYDWEGPAGVRWATIRFEAAAACRFTPDSACDEVMIQAYSRLLLVEESQWLTTLRERSRLVGQDLPASLRHYEVYFDHRGCIEVLAESAEVVPDE